MTHEELSDLYELYVLGALDAAESAELEEHLARNCPQCQSGVHRALGLGAFLATLPEVVEPPKRLRRRVLASVGEQRNVHQFWLGGLAFLSACLAIAVGILLVETTRRNDELASVREELRKNSSELLQANAVLQFLNQPGTRQVLFQAGQPQPPRGRVFINPQQGVLLLASNLPAPPSGKTYEMWVVPKAGAPVPAGLFRSDTQGHATFMRNTALDMASTKAIAVTMEPEAGSAVPTPPLVFVAPLGD